MTYNETKVAIVIPLYNDAQNISRAITSAATQKMPEGFQLEVIVVDDCSSDDSANIAEKLTETFPHLKVCRLEQNGGPSVARNEALAKTDAAWFTPLDSDDFMLETRIADLLATALENDLDFVADNLLMSSEAEPEKTDRVLWPDKPAGMVPLTASYFIERSYNMPVERSELGFLKPLINRRCLNGQVRAYRDDLRFGEDFELYTRLLLDGARACLIDPAGYYAIVRPQSASHVQSGRDHERLARVSRDIARRKNLNANQRRAIRGHLQYSENEWAWWTMIEAVRSRNIAKAISSLLISPASAGHVMLQLLKQAGARVRS